MYTFTTAHSGDGTYPEYDDMPVTASENSETRSTTVKRLRGIERKKAAITKRHKADMGFWVDELMRAPASWTNLGHAEHKKALGLMRERTDHQTRREGRLRGRLASREPARNRGRVGSSDPGERKRESSYFEADSAQAGPSGSGQPALGSAGRSPSSSAESTTARQVRARKGSRRKPAPKRKAAKKATRGK